MILIKLTENIYNISSFKMFSYKKKTWQTLYWTVATSINAIAIQSTENPLDEVVTVNPEKELVEQFNKPNSDNFEFFYEINALQYSSNLKSCTCFKLVT